nr:hypothetical protein [Armatimonas sp.]
MRRTRGTAQVAKRKYDATKLAAGLARVTAFETARATRQKP